MSDWSNIELGKNLKITSGFPFASNCFSNEDGFPLIRIRDILTSKIETYYQGSYLPIYIVKKGDIIVGMDGDFHIVKWKNENGLLNQRVLKIEVFDNNILSLDFVFYWLIPYLKKINDVTAATTVKHLSVKDIVKASCLLPNIKCQEKIATILTSIDTAIEKTAALIQKYQLIKAGLMHDLFTRGVTVDGKLRPPREQAPELYQETAIGWIPKEWDFIKLSNVLIRIDAGWSPECPEIPPSSGEWGVLKVSAVTKGFYDFSESKTLPYGLMPDSSIEVRNGDVILTRANGVAELVGITVQVKDSPDKLMLSDKLLRLVPEQYLMTKDFLALLMRSQVIKSQIEKSMSGSSGQRNISQSEIKNFECYKPSITEQNAISNKINCIDLKIDKEKQARQKLTLQKQGLMQDLLTGKVQVKV